MYGSWVRNEVQLLQNSENTKTYGRGRKISKMVTEKDRTKRLT